MWNEGPQQSVTRDGGATYVSLESSVEVVCQVVELQVVPKTPRAQAAAGDCVQLQWDPTLANPM